MGVVFGRYHPITIVRDAGSAHEKRWEAKAGGTLDTNALLHPDVDIKQGDELHAVGLDEPRVVIAVHPKWASSGLTHYEVDLMPLTTYREQIRARTPVQQIIHGDVGHVAGRDITLNVSVTVLLNALDEAVQRADIPESERKSLRQKIRELADNPYVTNVASSLLTECIKKAIGL